MAGKGALEYFTDDVLSGKVREINWVRLLNGHCRAETSEESWAKLRAWAKEHGIRWDHEERIIGRKREIWIIFSPPPMPLREHP